jgi:alanyl-tRNA synthetase
MLGNFSIGDYFKKEAVALAWEMITQRFGISPDQLYATVYLDDEEAYHHWRDDIGIPDERIYRYGGKDNWWGPAGLEGPCGPCSELHYDSGPEHGCGALVSPEELTEAQRNGEEMPPCHPNCECERFVELWNLVFMQFYQDLEGNRTPLPAPSIDTGMGLERAAAVLQNKRNLYETDLFQTIVAGICNLTGKSYGVDTETDYAIRVVAEHARGVSFLIADGVVPGNEGRGYVLRRIIRRAIRYGRRLGLQQPFLTEVASTAIQRFQDAYPELAENRDFIMRVISLEEERFALTFERGSAILSDLLEARRGAYNGAQSVSGQDTFTLYDTYGFPPELTAEIAREHGLRVDMEGFEREMEAQRQQSRAVRSFTGSMEMLTVYESLGVGRSEFTGYSLIQRESVVAALMVDGVSVGHATQGQPVEVVLAHSPFYAEGGGQLGDRGQIRGPNGLVAVEDTHSPVAGLIVQRGVVDQGSVAVGDNVQAEVDSQRRQDASRNHSGTHLLHAALRSVLGPHVRQAGSLVAPERSRFDFSHVSQLSRDELLGVQALANDRVRANLAVTSRETTYSDAVRDGALAFFGDRYGDVVRVVTMAEEGDSGHRGAFSVEVCGGTHVHATGQVGTLLVLGESGIGGGMRRIEALTGRAAEQLFIEQSDQLDRLAQRLQTPVVDLETRLDSFIEDAEQVRRRLTTLEREALRREAQELLEGVADVDGVKVLAGRTSAANAEAMREMGDFLKTRLESAVLVMGGIVDERPTLVAMVTDDLVASGLHAGNIVKEAAQVMGGGGGGRPNLAQAGGRHADRLDASLQSVADIVRRTRSQG